MCRSSTANVAVNRPTKIIQTDRSVYHETKKNAFHAILSVHQFRWGITSYAGGVRLAVDLGSCCAKRINLSACSSAHSSRRVPALSRSAGRRAYSARVRDPVAGHASGPSTLSGTIMLALNWASTSAWLVLHLSYTCLDIGSGKM